MTEIAPPKAKLYEGVWLPETEVHFVDMMRPGGKRFQRDKYGRSCYQKHKLDAAVALLPVDRRRLAIDIGGHVGLWAMHMVEYFEMVVSFEPIIDFATIYPFNMKKDNWRLYNVGLGEKEELVDFAIDGPNTGHTHVIPGNKFKLQPLDSFAEFENVDFIKIDVEGFELPVVKGGINLIKKWKPIIVIEQKGNDQKYYKTPRGAAAQYLKSQGMIDLIPPIAGDHILGWPK